MSCTAGFCWLWFYEQAGCEAGGCAGRLDSVGLSISAAPLGARRCAPLLTAAEEKWLHNVCVLIKFFATDRNNWHTVVCRCVTPSRANQAVKRSGGFGQGFKPSCAVRGWSTKVTFYMFYCAYKTKRSGSLLPVCIWMLFSSSCWRLCFHFLMVTFC